jgi:hypothetical protein
MNIGGVPRHDFEAQCDKFDKPKWNDGAGARHACGASFHLMKEPMMHRIRLTLIVISGAILIVF